MQCVFCGERLPLRGYVFVAFYEMNAPYPYRSGYVCIKCQIKLLVRPQKEEAKQ